MERRRRPRLTASEGRRFGLTVGIAFLVIAGVLLWRDRDMAARVAGVLGGLLAIGGLVVPTLLGPVERAWMGLARVLARITTPIVMALVYFLAVTPIGLFMRAIGRNPLTRAEKRDGFWVTRAPGARRGDLTRKF